jgi:carboxymethylenebutenolidase
MDQSTRQRAIDLYDRYTHDGMDRRNFMAEMTRIAGSVAAAELLVSAIAASPAAAAVVPADDRRLTARTQDLVGGYKAYVAEPRSRSLKPTVLVVHENRGLNPYIEDVARRFAKAGYMAFAPDGLTSVGGYPGDEQKGVALFRTVDGKKMTEDFVASAYWLKKHKESTGKLGAVGFCFGGGMVNQLAVRLGKDLNAGVAFYGNQAGIADVPKIQAPLMFQYAGNDQRINANIPAYEAALKENGKKFESFMYEGKQHGFHNDTTPRYDAEAAKLAWERTLEHFKKNLK